MLRVSTQGTIRKKSHRKMDKVMSEIYQNFSPKFMDISVLKHNTLKSIIQIMGKIPVGKKRNTENVLILRYIMVFMLHQKMMGMQIRCSISQPKTCEN